MLRHGRAQVGLVPTDVCSSVSFMVRLENSFRLADGDPIRVSVGACGNGHRLVVERRRIQRGVQPSRPSLGSIASATEVILGRVWVAALLLHHRSSQRVIKRIRVKPDGQAQGRNLCTGQAERWTRQWFVSLRPQQLMSMIRYPGVA